MESKLIKEGFSTLDNNFFNSIAMTASVFRTAIDKINKNEEGIWGTDELKATINGSICCKYLMRNQRTYGLDKNSYNSICNTDNLDINCDEIIIPHPTFLIWPYKPIKIHNSYFNGHNVLVDGELNAENLDISSIIVNFDEIEPSGGKEGDVLIGDSERSVVIYEEKHLGHQSRLKISAETVNEVYHCIESVVENIDFDIKDILGYMSFTFLCKNDLLKLETNEKICSVNNVCIPLIKGINIKDLMQHYISDTAGPTSDYTDEKCTSQSKLWNIAVGVIAMLTHYPEYVKETPALEKMSSGEKKKKYKKKNIPVFDLVSAVPLNPIKQNYNVTGRMVKPHWRKSHWRRQPHGDLWRKENPGAKEFFFNGTNQAYHMVLMEKSKIGWKED